MILENRGEIMKYKPLKVVGYENYKEFNNEYNKRITSPASIITNLHIYPYSQQKGHKITEKEFPLFCFMLPEIQKLTEDILTNSNKISGLLYSMPPIAQNNLVFSQLTNEIQSTNEIEGVRSTKKEISTAIHSNTKEKVRFDGIVNMYKEIINGEKTKISDLSDFREIYDNLLSEEIDIKNELDGNLFRKEPVYIEDGNKTIHQGDINEININNNLIRLIDFMNNSNISFLIKAIITHYFFGYIHPFYDGNGRMGRFLLSSYLARKIDLFTSISISESVANNKKKYGDAFSEVSHPKNNGDLTNFVIDIMEIIISGQENMIEETKIQIKKLKNAEEYIDNNDYSDREKQVLFLYVQNHLFEYFDRYISNKEIADILRGQLSRNLIDKTTKKLEQKETLVKINNKPIVYKFSDKLINILE